MKIPLVDTVQKSRIVIDDSPLRPTRQMIASKNFHKLYKEHLESFIFTEDFKFHPLIPILIVVEYMEDDLIPIQVVTGYSKMTNRKAINVLREVISENYELISIILPRYKARIKRSNI